MISKNTSNKPLPPREDGTSAPRYRLATVREACSYGRFGHTKCYALINDGKIFAVKEDPERPSSRTRICLDSIDAYYASMKRIEPKSRPAT